MAYASKPSELKAKEEQLAKLADMLGIDIAPPDLAALSHQLVLLQALEESALQDFAPILTMDADWRD